MNRDRVTQAMLKRIDISDLELGMFVHKLEGNWFRHPFWKSRFVLTDEQTLNTLRHSAVPAVVIDTEKGLDLRPAAVLHGAGGAARRPSILAPGARRAGRAQSGQAVPRFDFRSTLPQPLAREFGNATRVADRSRKVINRVFLESRLGKSIKASVIEPVVEDIFASIQRNPHAFLGLMRCKRDNEFIYRHSLAVSALMISLAKQMKLSADDTRAAGMAGLMLDMGVMHLPVDLAALGGDFRRIDEKIFAEHARLGADLMAAGGIPDPVVEAIHEHHERLDGTGYPRKLKGDAISLFGRMAAICDTYDWLVNDSIEGTGLDPASSVAQMGMMTGWFDSEILRHFNDTVGLYPIGSVVLLGSGRLAMVVGQDEAEALLPEVRTFWSAKSRKAIPPVDIQLARCFGEDRIGGTVDPSDYGCDDFVALRERLFAAKCTAD
jgi:putative nucleotidyltransferase with HDIG domain